MIQQYTTDKKDHHGPYFTWPKINMILSHSQLR